MHVPTDRWSRGGWNQKRPQFRLLAEMLGLEQSDVSPADLQNLYQKVATAKVFQESVNAVLEAAGGTRKSAAQRLEEIESRLGLMEPIPFMSLEGIAAPQSFAGVAIWPTGITNWTKLRLEQILLALEAGAHIRHIVCLNSFRTCNAAADRRHPLIAGIPEGAEPNERSLQFQLAYSSGIDPELFRFPSLPDVNDQGRPLSLEQQLLHLNASGQYDELIGGADIYVPSTPNSLYVPLHVRRVLGHDNVWFSQAGARLVRVMPDWWWPPLQDVMTTPQGIIRLWVELLHAGCMTA